MKPVLATQILRDDHKRLTGLFRQLEGVDRRAHEMKRGVLGELFMEIEIHFALKEQLFYPAILASLKNRNEGMGLSPTLIDGNISDLREIKELVQRMQKLPIDSLDFQDRLEELEDLLRGHLESEDQLTFHAAEALLGEDLAELGAQLQDLRDDLLCQPKYDRSRAEFVQNPSGGEQMRISNHAARRV